MRKVDIWVLIMNIVVTLFSATMSMFYLYSGANKYYNADYVALMTFIYLVLFGSVCRMRGTIKSLAYSFPNERLMFIHFINFPIWIVLSAAYTVLGMISTSMENNPVDSAHELKRMKILFAASAIANVQILFSFWLGLWLLYLILKSTTVSNLDKYGVHDLVLGRKVPPIVFIKNRSLLKQIVTNELENDSTLR